MTGYHPSPTAAPPRRDLDRPAGGHAPDRQYLRVLVLRDPVRALHVLQPGTVVNTVLRETLRAEAHLRLGRYDDALTAAGAASTTAERATSPRPMRLAIALTVRADISCRTGSHDALAICQQLHALAAACRDQRRMLLAEVLHAVAAHRHDPQAGRDQLCRVHDQHLERHGDDPITRMLSTGLHALHSPPQSSPPVGRPAPVPGGLLRPDLARPARHYLRDLVDASTAAMPHHRAGAGHGPAGRHHRDPNP